ncbi:MULTISPECIES: hypothetical protein [unclassified Okeania]|uniref:hypothetical protein n=1 Tax=unclassified Okeania TaxID=2634635 RepID=UPI0013B6FFB0|nr:MULTISPECIES: hypothetical protein [unclassified Okeania]NES75395.1 hypothetical protein [Okeania sp. SIO1H4]NET19067.1 hypothetical protein [Okeania sp. SIO1H5]NET92840.1 hypothetical protein [Okeania sp. SIO1H2]
MFIDFFICSSAYFHLKKETGDRRQEENYMGILTPSNFEHRVDGGVLNPQRK